VSNLTKHNVFIRKENTGLVRLFYISSSHDMILYQNIMCLLYPMVMT